MPHHQCKHYLKAEHVLEIKQARCGDVEGRWMCLQRAAEAGGAGQEAWRKSTEEIYGSTKRVDEDSWSVSGGCRGQGEVEADDWLRPP